MKKKVSSALINHKDTFALQLRDGKANIFFPNHWGLFGGHLEDHEDCFAALKRELFEELKLFVESAISLGTVETQYHRINLFLVPWSGDLSRLELCEGQEFGVFRIENIMTGYLHSNKYKKKFPITPGCAACFNFYYKLIH